MSDLHDLWQDLFSTKISPLEEDLMRGISEHIDEKDPVILLAAVLVHMLTKVLLQDPASPFRIASRLGKAMEELEASLISLRTHASGVEQYVKDLRGDANLTLHALEQAREYAKEGRKKPAPILKLDPEPGSAAWRYTLSPNALGRVTTSAFLASFFGSGLMTAAILLLLR